MILPPSQRPFSRPSLRPSTRSSLRPSQRPSSRLSLRPFTHLFSRPSQRPPSRPSLRPSTRSSSRPSQRPASTFSFPSLMLSASPPSPVSQSYVVMTEFGLSTIDNVLKSYEGTVWRRKVFIIDLYTAKDHDFILYTKGIPGHITPSCTTMSPILVIFLFKGDIYRGRKVKKILTFFNSF